MEETQEEQPISLEELENKLLNHIQNPQEDQEILRWNTEGTHIPEMLGLIQKPDVNPQVLNIAIGYFKNHVFNFFSSLSQEEKIEYVNNFHQLCFSQTDKFSSPEILDTFSNIVASSIILCFDENETIFQMIHSFFEPDLSNIELFILCASILGDLTKEAKRRSVYLYSSTYCPMIYDYCITHLKTCIEHIEDGPALFAIRKLTFLLYEAMKFEIKEQEDAEKSLKSAVSYKFSEESDKILLQEDMIPMLFHILSNQNTDGFITRNIYRLLFFLCDLNVENFAFIQEMRTQELIESGKIPPPDESQPDPIMNIKAREEKDKIYHSYFEKFLSFFLQYLDIYQFSDETITGLCFLLQKVNVVLCAIPGNLSFDHQKFVESAIKVQQPIFTVDNLIQYTLAAQYVIQFWQNRKGYPSEKSTLFFSFLDIIIQGIQSSSDYAEKFLGVEEQSLFDELRKLAVDNTWDVYEKLKEYFEKATVDFYSKMETSAPEPEAAVLAFLVTFLIKISPGSSIRLRNEDAENLAYLYRTVFEIFDNVFAVEAIPPYYVQHSLITFGDCIPGSFLASGNPDFFKFLAGTDDPNSPFASIDGVYSFIMLHLVDFFTQNYPEDLLRDSAYLLQKLFKDTKSLRVALNRGPAERLITLRENGTLNYAKSNEVRKLLHSALGALLISTIPSPLDSMEFLKSQYDAIFEGHIESSLALLETAMIDFSGFFNNLSCTHEFMLFFEYVFPEKLQHFTNIIGLIQDNPQKIFSLLDFWISMLKNTKIISFKNHSPKGLQLFKISQTFMHKMLEIVGPKIKELGWAEESSEFMVKMATIFNFLLDNGYTPYNAFLSFNDPVLLDMINDFISLIQIFDVDTEMQYPSLGIAIIQAMKALCKRHINIVVEAGHGDIILASIGSYLLQCQNPKEGCLALLNLVQNINDITVLDHDSFVRIFLIIWGHIYRKTANTQPQEVIYTIYRIFPDLIFALQERVLQFATKTEEFNEIFNEYAEQLANECPDKTAFSNHTTNFANRTRMLISAPHLAFC